MGRHESTKQASAAASSPEVVYEYANKQTAAAPSSSSIFSKLKSVFKSPAAEREKEILAQRPPRRDSDEWSYMTDPEDPSQQVKKRKKKMVTYNGAYKNPTALMYGP